ncbi:hypothetical protein Tco_0841045 [Tanacetum coccineum]|uniref:Integrase, catalytic region, zinc finger, CCHC-type, peptidase aspartic, catalytic n=1 Tax=Tanacetum coccineum TaxID=301880 RepID=A0ABQ5AYT7_9ASTR
MRAIFNQMETVVPKCFVDKKYFEIEKKELSLDNDPLLEHIICQDVMNVVMHVDIQNVLSANNNSAFNDYKSMEQSFLDGYEENLKLQTKLDKKNDMIEKAVYNELSKRSQLKAKNVLIEKLKEYIANIKGKNVVDSVQHVHNSNVVISKVYKLNFPPLSPCIKNNMAAHVEYLKQTQENVDILHEIVEHARELRSLYSDLASDCTFITRIQELLVYVSATCPSLKHVSDKLVAITPMNRTRKVRFAESSETSKDKHNNRSNTKKDKITQTSSINKKKNKVEEQPRIAKYSLNNVNHVSKTVCNKNVKHSMLNANSELICATRHECMFDAIHDLCVRDYLNDANARVKSKSVKSRSAKSKKKKMWKPIGKVYTNVRYSWKPTGRIFTIDGKTYPLTRSISTKIVPPRKSILTTPVKQTQPSSNKSGKLKDITNVYCVEGLGHNFFSVGQFCDSNLKVALAVSQILVQSDCCVLAKKAYRIYNKITRQIMETIHVTFDDLTTMASEQFSSGPTPQLMTLGTLSSGLVPNPPSSTPFPTNVDRRPDDPTGSLVLTSLEHDAPSASTSSNQEHEQSIVISKSVEEKLQSIQFDNTLFQDTPSEESYSNV